MSKITLTRGCTAFGFDIDGERIIDLNEKRLSSLLDIVITTLKEKHEVSTSNILETLVEYYGDYEHDPHICESCGDTVDWHTLEI